MVAGKPRCRARTRAVTLAVPKVLVAFYLLVPLVGLLLAHVARGAPDEREASYLWHESLLLGMGLAVGLLSGLLGGGSAVPGSGSPSRRDATFLMAW